MKIIIEPSDFDEHYGPPERVAESVRTALNFAYTIEVMKQPDTSAGVRQAEATFHDVPRQMGLRIVGPIEVEFREPLPAAADWRDRPLRDLEFVASDAFTQPERND